MHPRSVLACDPCELFREGFKRLLQDETFAVTMEAASLKEVLALAARTDPPDLVVTEVAGPGMDGIATLPALRALWPDVKIVVLTSEPPEAAVPDCLDAGADGFLTKDISPAALRRSLQRVMLGERVFPDDPAPAPAHGGAAGGAEAPAPAARWRLSEREIQVLRLLLNGCSNKMIARELGISEATVKVHLKGVLRKVQATNRTQAAIWALNNGFAEPAAAGPA